MAKRKKNEDIQTFYSSEKTSESVSSDLLEDEIPALELEPVLEKQTSQAFELGSNGVSSFIPKSFSITERPLLLTWEELEKFESKDRYMAYLKAGNTVKLFKLVEPITEDEEIADRYKVQYEAIAYKGQTMQRLYRERLDADYKVIEQEHLS